MQIDFYLSTKSRSNKMTNTVGIDYVKLQIDLLTAEKQNKAMNGIIYALTTTYNNLHINYGTPNKGIMTHEVLTAGKRILELKSGIYLTGSKKDTRRKTIYYISIELAGTKQYTAYDEVATNCLVRMCAFLNNNNYRFIFTGIDVCVDIQCPMFRTLVFCNRKASGVKYYKIGESQPHSSTRYIEKYNRTHKRVMRRSYVYYKRIDGDYSTSYLTRFEMKLQSRYFNRNDYDSNTIRANLDKYHILYFSTADEQIDATELYRTNESTIRRRDLHKLGLERYRIYPNTREVEKFLFSLYEVYEEDLNLPARKIADDWM